MTIFWNSNLGFTRLEGTTSVLMTKCCEFTANIDFEPKLVVYFSAMLTSRTKCCRKLCLSLAYVDCNACNALQSSRAMSGKEPKTVHLLSGFRLSSEAIPFVKRYTKVVFVCCVKWQPMERRSHRSDRRCGLKKCKFYVTNYLCDHWVDCEDWLQDRDSDW